MTPGVTRVCAAVVAVGAILLAAFLLIPRDYYTGTNGTRTRGMLLEINKSAPVMCAPGLVVPAGTGQMELEVDTDGLPLAATDFTLRTRGRVLRDRLPQRPGGRQKIRFSFPEVKATSRGTACVRLADGGRSGGKVFFGGVPGSGLGEAVRIDGVAQPARAAIWWRPPPGEKAAPLFHLPTLFQRVSLFRPGWAGPWLYWLLFLVVAPGLVWASLRLLLHPERKRRLPLAVLIGLVGFANGATWAHVTPAFNSPDESEHFAYVQSLTERGKPPDATPGGPRSAYSSQESLALTATRVLDGNETPDGKPLWERADERAYERTLRSGTFPRGDGGGYEAATSSHSPLFYGLAAPAYALGRGGGVFAELTLVRLFSALLAGLVAACAVLIVRELAPSHPRLAAAAGVSVAFQPMFAFMGGSFNNDMGVNAAGAVLTLLLVRLLRRGFSVPLALGVGVTVAVAPLMKLTGYATYPASLLAVLLALYRFRSQWRRALPGAALIVVAIVVVSLGWGELASHIGRSTFTTPDGQAPGANAPLTQDPTATLTYVWQVFLPSLPGMNEHWAQSWPAFDIFGIRGWGAFGWYAVTWPHIVYWVIMVLLVALTLCGVSLAVRRWPEIRRRLPEALVLLGLAGGTIFVMTAGYYSPVPQGDTFPIQGRYVFPAITSLAALFVLSTLGAGRRLAAPLATGLATAVVCLGYASLWLTLVGFYFSA